MEGRLKLNDDITIIIKKLNFSDFLGCDFVPLVFSHVKSDSKKKDNDDSYLKELFNLAITQVISNEYSREIALDFIYKNENFKQVVFEYIYAFALNLTKDSKPLIINKRMASNIHSICKEYGKLPTELLSECGNDIDKFNLNLMIMNAGREDNYRSELMANLEALGHKCNGKETTDQLEKLLKAKREKQNGRR